MKVDYKLLGLSVLSIVLMAGMVLMCSRHNKELDQIVKPYKDEIAQKEYEIDALVDKTIKLQDSIEFTKKLIWNSTAKIDSLRQEIKKKRSGITTMPADEAVQMFMDSTTGGTAQIVPANNTAIVPIESIRIANLAFYENAK